MSNKKIEVLSRPDASKARSRLSERKVVRSDIQINPSLEVYKGKSFYIKTYGCQGNVRDSETFAGIFKAMGMVETEDPKEATIVLLNTCAVRENAEEKVYGEIGKFKDRQKADPSFVLVVAGCVMQEEGIGEKLMTSYPQVSLVIGTHNINELPEYLASYVKGRRPLMSVYSKAGEVVESLPVSRSDPYKAYVDISYGCDKFCTYCIVPYTRGRERSRDLKDIVKECQDLYLNDYQEVTLLGQNVNSYGKDLKDTSFAELLDKVAEIGIPRIRYLTSHPWDFNDEMIRAMKRHPNIMKWIHLPLQSGSTKVLKEMGRRYSKEEYLALVEKIRTEIPEIELSTDIIVGFPGETEEDFLETIEVVKKVGFDSAFTFIYSPRPGTPAAAREDQVPEEIKHERFNRLVKAVEVGVSASSERMVGKTYEVLVDGPSKRDKAILSGYTEGNKLVNFPGPEYLKGCLVRVKIKESHTYSLLGELDEDPVLAKAKQVASFLERDLSAKEFISHTKELKDDLSFRENLSLLSKAQKAVALSRSEEEHHKAVEELNKLQDLIDNDPRYANREALKEEVEGLLRETEAILK